MNEEKMLDALTIEDGFSADEVEEDSFDEEEYFEGDDLDDGDYDEFPSAYEDDDCVDSYLPYDADYLDFLPDDEKYELAYENGYRGGAW